jgi:integrase
VLLLAIGLRRGEVLGVRWGDVDLDGGVLRVRQTLQRAGGRLQFVPPKSERSRRSVPLPLMAVSALREHRVRMAREFLTRGRHLADGDLVFVTVKGTPVEPCNLNRFFVALLQAAKLRHIRLHDLRHTCATLLLAQGVPARVVMEMLGHSAIAVTMNTYAHVMPSLLRDAADHMDEVLKA